MTHTSSYSPNDSTYVIYATGHATKTFTASPNICVIVYDVGIGTGVVTWYYFCVVYDVGIGTYVTMWNRCYRAYYRCWRWYLLSPPGI